MSGKKCSKSNWLMDNSPGRIRGRTDDVRSPMSFITPSTFFLPQPNKIFFFILFSSFLFSLERKERKKKKIFASFFLSWAFVSPDVFSAIGDFTGKKRNVFRARKKSGNCGHFSGPIYFFVALISVWGGLIFFPFNYLMGKSVL